MHVRTLINTSQLSSISGGSTTAADLVIWMFMLMWQYHMLLDPIPVLFNFLQPTDFVGYIMQIDQYKNRTIFSIHAFGVLDRCQLPGVKAVPDLGQ